MRDPVLPTALATLAASAALLWLGASDYPPMALQATLGLAFLLVAPASGWVAALSIRPMWVSSVLTVMVSLTLSTLAALAVSYFDTVAPLESIGLTTLIALSGQLFWWFMRRRRRFSFESETEW